MISFSGGRRERWKEKSRGRAFRRKRRKERALRGMKGRGGRRIRGIVWLRSIRRNTLISSKWSRISEKCVTRSFKTSARSRPFSLVDCAKSWKAKATKTANRSPSSRTEQQSTQMTSPNPNPKKSSRRSPDIKKTPSVRPRNQTKSEFKPQAPNAANKATSGERAWITS